MRKLKGDRAQTNEPKPTNQFGEHSGLPDCYPPFSSVVDWDSPTANIYGCQPCPKCDSKYRASYRESGMIECDDCGLKQPYTFANPDEEQSR